MHNHQWQKSICCLAILILQQLISVDCQALIRNIDQSELQQQQQPVNNADWTESEELEIMLHPFDNLLNNIVPPFLGLPSRDLNGTDDQFRAEAMADTSNDDAIFMSAEQLIKRSGFNYEIHEVISDDGYITLLIRIINPLADRTKLRRPPVMLMHGGLVDPTAYLISSSIQHFPEPWPIDPKHQAHGERSSNRSLAFMLANNGFDVFIAETRGSNEYNRRHVKTKALTSALEGKDLDKNMTRNEVIHGIHQQFDYWSFTEDDLIQHEIKAQMDKIMEVTQSQTISLFVFSLSTRTSLGFLAIRPDYARKVRGYICMSPMISGEGMAGASKLLIQNICTASPKFLGQFVLSDVLLTPQVRSIIVDISKHKWVRYTIIKFLISIMVGSSAKYRTNLELNVISHLLLHLNFKMVKQMCQSTFADRFQKYDYGKIGNKLIYKSDKPPVYDLSNLQVEDWITISGTNDNFGTPKSYEHLMSLVNPKPAAHFIAPGFSHLDLFAGFENDIYVNLPILEYLIRKSDLPSFNNTNNNSKTIDTPVNNNDKINTQNKNNNNNTKSIARTSTLSVNNNHNYNSPNENKHERYPAETISSFRTFKLPFLDFKPENIIEASSGSKESEDKKDYKSYSNSAVSSLGNFFKFEPSSFKMPSFLGGLGSGSGSGGNPFIGIFGGAPSTPSLPGPLDFIMKPFSSVKTATEAVGDVATQTAAKSPISIPVITDAAKLADLGKQQYKIIDEVKVNINRLFSDFTRFFVPIKTKSTTRK